MKISKIPLLLLVVLLCVTVSESWLSRRSRRTCSVRPTRYRHLPAAPRRCSRRSSGVFRGKRSPKSYEEDRSDNEIRNEHNELINAGYEFIGWHGTSYEAGHNLVNGEAFRLNERQGNDRLWMGVWTSSNVERSVGYMGDDPVLLRTYINLPRNAQRSVFLDASDINNAVTTPFFCSHVNPTPAQMMDADGQYIIAGPDGAFSGQELILSRALIPHVRFRYSAHNRDISSRYGCAEHRTNPENIESTSVSWSMNNVNAFLRDVRQTNVFSNYRWHDELA